MNKAKRQAIFERFRAQNPAPTTELIYHSHFELLIAVVLSAQTTDARVNIVTERLFKIANTPAQIYALGEARLADMIRSVNYYKTKARHIIQTCLQLTRDHQGEVPASREALEALPGVGRKTANVLLNTLFGMPTVAVDTHIFRVAHRIGLAQGKTPEAVEQGLIQTIPKPFLKDAHHWLILHGRYTCVAKHPKCRSCLIQDLCEYAAKAM